MWMGHHMKTSLDHSRLILKLSNHFQWRLHSAQPFSNFTAHYHITVTLQLPNLKATAPLCKFCQLNLSLLSSSACQHITTARRCQQNCFSTLSASAIWSTKRSHHQKTWGSGPLLCMARVLVHLGKLLMLILTITLPIEYYINRNWDMLFRMSKSIIYLLTVNNFN